MEMTTLSTSRTRDLLASAALIAIVAAPLVPEPAAAEGLLVAMHDMVPAQMQPPVPNVQHGPVRGMMEGEHGGTSGQMQQHGSSGQAPMGGDMMQGGQGGMSGTMQHGSPMGGMSAADEHARMM